MALDILGVNVCCVQEACVQDYSSLIRLTSVNFHLPVFGDTEAAASGVTDIGLFLSEKPVAALLDWIPVNSRLCPVKLRGS